VKKKTLSAILQGQFAFSPPHATDGYARTSFESAWIAKTNTNN